MALNIFSFPVGSSGGGGPPTGPAGGDLTGTYPNPTLAVDRVRIIGDTMTGALNINGSAPASVQLRVRGAAAQSTNIQEWQNSGGTVLDGIDSGGRAFFGTTASVSTVSLYVVGQGAGNTTIRVQGGAAQTGDVLAAYDGGGQNRAGITGDLRIYTGSVGGAIANAQLGSVCTAGTAIGLLARANAAQTANIIEIQNSAATVLSGFGPAGQVFSNFSPLSASFSAQLGNHVTGAIVLGINGQTGTTVNLTRWLLTGTGTVGGVENLGAIYIGAANLGGTLSVNNALNPVGNTVIIARGRAGQTGNLFETQNSGGAVGFFVRANLTAGMGAGTAGAPTLSFSANSSTGIFSPSSGVGLTAGGTERLRAVTTGVGIGSTTVNSTLQNGGSFSESAITTVAANTNLASTDYICRVNSGAGAFTITLPNIAAAQIGVGKRYRIKDSGGNALVNNITVATTGGDTIDTAATALINLNFGSMELIAGTGTNWDII